MKAVQLLVNSVLPEDLRNYDQTYDVKSLNKIMNAVGKKYPEQFDDILHKIANIGRKASYYQGETITLDDLENVIDKDALFAEMDKEIAALPKDKNFIRKRREIFQKYNELMEKETGKAALANRNNLAMAILSGARGKSPQLKAMVTSPGTYSDYKGEPIDVFSRTSFAEGLSPTAFAASTYGSRAAVVSTKCLDYQSLTKMADLSEKRLCDIKVGDMVLGADKEGNVFPVKVLNVFDQGEKECYKYTFRYSNSKIDLNDVHVTCTEDHKFLVISAREYGRKQSLHRRGNGPAPTWRDRHNKEIHPASKFKRASRASDYNPLLPQGGLFGTKYEPWARILGLLIGDGCLVGKQVRCTLSCADEQLIEEITPELTALGQKIKKVGGDNFSWNITKADYDPTQNNSIVKGVQGFVAGSLMDRNQMLKDYGLLGHYAWEKRFPIGWQSWDEESMKNLIAGLFAADGSVFSTLMRSQNRTQVSVSFGMTSEDCLKDLREALMYGFGISSRFEKPATKGGFGSTTDERVHPLYALEISRAEDVIKFCEVFSDYVPGIKRAKLVEETSKIVIKDHNPYAKAMFLEKEYVGKVHCMDIEVDHPDHLFVLANGLITSNSSTAKGGDLAKQMAQSTVDMVARERDCGTHNGLVYGIDESTLKGRVLARETAGIPADTLIDREVLHKLRKAGVEEVEARSPLTCSVKHGLCSRCIGKYYNGGKWAPVGTHVGAIAASSSFEPVTQMALCLHADTQVVMADGGFKKIKDIIPGDIVIGSDRRGNQKPVEVISKFRQGTKKARVYVAEAYSDYSTEDPFSLVPQDYSVMLHVTCTPEHKMLMSDGSIRPIDDCITYAEENLYLNTIYGKAKVVSSSGPMDAPCYDIEVDHPDHLFLLANGMITSNSAKHTAGMTQSKKTYSGLDALIQFTQSPEKFKDQGAVSELDGKVENIEEAPQGGMLVTIAGKQHYVPQGHEVEVKVGDKVEAGDQLAEGLVDAEDIVRLKGLGEGRKYYAERLNKMLADSGAATDKRNTEIIARGALRHVRVTNDEGMGDYLPDDVIDYNALQGSYRPSETSQKLAPDAAVGKYLQTPVMHYTIGTRITPKVAANLKKHNHNEIDVDDVEPGFKAEMIRLRASSHTNPDWLASLGTSYLGKQLNEASTKGDDTNVLENVDYRPRLAFGKDFGRKADQTGIF